MREIKFRAWANGKYWYSDDEAYVLKYIDGQTGLYEDENFYKESRTPDYILISNDLEQYIGLKDKNGKEIYFLSDIVRATVTDDLTGEVSLLDGVLYLCLKTYKIVMRGHETFNLIFAEDLEIIGNIHEGENNEDRN
jgi:uncharacterized phage protein (TIGR01671 family)